MLHSGAIDPIIAAIPWNRPMTKSLPPPRIYSTQKIKHRIATKAKENKDRMK